MTTNNALDYRVSIRSVEPQGNLLAYADVVINERFKITGFKLLSGGNGLFIGNPGIKREGGDGYNDICVGKKGVMT